VIGIAGAPLSGIEGDEKPQLGTDADPPKRSR
jgi:hypothetical protein